MYFDNKLYPLVTVENPDASAAEGALIETDFVISNLLETTTAFVLRLTQEQDSSGWRIILKPIDGSTPRVFDSLESAFLFLARRYTDAY